MKPHPQADILRAIADGKQIQYRYSSGWIDTGYIDILGLLYNKVDCQFRIKPKTININGIEVPEPMREEPKKGTQVWVADLMNAGEVTCTSWYSGVAHKDYLKNGLCHLTEEAATIHANALLSFSRRI